MGQDLPSVLINLSTQGDSEKLPTVEKHKSLEDLQMMNFVVCAGLITFVQVVLTCLESFG